MVGLELERPLLVLNRQLLGNWLFVAVVLVLVRVLASLLLDLAVISLELWLSLCCAFALAALEDALVLLGGSNSGGGGGGARGCARRTRSTGCLRWGQGQSEGTTTCRVQRRSTAAAAASSSSSNRCRCPSGQHVALVSLPPSGCTTCSVGSHVPAATTTATTTLARVVKVAPQTDLSRTGDETRSSRAAQSHVRPAGRLPGQPRLVAWCRLVSLTGPPNRDRERDSVMAQVAR